jgi:hypothetical protein
MADMAHDGSIEETRTRVLQDHSSLRLRAQEMQYAQSHSELLGRLHELRSLLESHFALEEVEGGFFERIRRLTPAHLQRIEELRSEHRIFLEEIDRLAARVRTCLERPVAERLDEARALAHRLNDHEARENVLLVDAMAPETAEGGGAGAGSASP